MQYKLLLFVILFFSFIQSRDSSDLYNAAMEKNRFDFNKTAHQSKGTTPPATPFWETGKKKDQYTDTTALKHSNWFAQAIKGIEESEYEIKYDELTESYVSPNRKNNLKAFYSSSSFRLLPRNYNEEKWKLDLTLQGIYTGQKKIYSPTSNAIVKLTGKTIQFNHNNQFTTEYFNSTEGVRQNFIINQRPTDDPKKLTVRLKANKGWAINKVNDKEIHFARRNICAKDSKTGYDKKVTYNGLKVWDANNKELEASFTVKNDFISINVIAENAVYPLTIDPLSTGTLGTPDWIGDDANQVGAGFGVSVASAGDVNGDGFSDVIIGAYSFDDGANTDEGRAFVYYGSLTGLVASPSSTPDDADQAGAYFGWSVAGAGDINGDGYSDVIIGAVNYTDGLNTNEGLAFVYYGSITGLAASPGNIPDDANQIGASFGYSVACAGDVNGDGYSDVIIGAPYYDDGGNTDEGWAFVYYGNPGGLSAVPNNTPDDANQAIARFGISVASAGDVNGDGYSDIIIGANGYDDGGNTDEGRAFVYYGSSTGLGAAPGSTPDDADQAGAIFGTSVACAGDVNGDGYSDVIIGANNYDDGANTDEGRAFVYYGGLAGLSAVPNNTPDDADQANAHFGCSVACAGDLNGDGYSDLIIGAFQYDDGGNTDEGRAYIYYGSASGLAATPLCTLDDADQANAFFGYSVACAGDINGDGYSDVIIGAYKYDDGGNTDEGRAFVYNGSPSGISTNSNAQFYTAIDDTWMGYSVASAGDVNADGYSDVIVGAFRFTTVFAGDGKAFLYLGSSTGLSASPSWTAYGTSIAEFFGQSVSSAGDVNGDGYGDLIIGSPDFTNGIVHRGRVSLFYGNAGGLAASPAWTFESDNGSRFGLSISCAGDINSDGYSDFLVGAPEYSSPEVNEGKVYLFFGSSTGPKINNWTKESNQAGAQFGSSVSSAGDANGDGYGDIIIGSTRYDNPEIDEGAAFVYYGYILGISAIGPTILEYNQAGALMGSSVSCAGDVNGDGFSDVIVGARAYSNPELAEGAAFIYHGSVSGVNNTIQTTLESNQVNAQLGNSVAGAGDVNGDGYSDVIVGAPYFDNGQGDEGAAFVYHGSTTGISTTIQAQLERDHGGSYLGYSVSGAGDVNGDGYSDVIIGAYLYNNTNYHEGGSFVYHGNKGGGLRNNIRIYNTDLITPISRNNINDPNLFGTGFFVKSVLGRIKGKLVWEVKKEGQAFSGNPITNSATYLDKQSSFTDLGIAGTELKNNAQKQGRENKVRVRVEFDKVTALTGQLFGPWHYTPGYTQGMFGMNAIPLPLTMIAFNGQFINPDDVQLQWITANELNMKSFVMERSYDGLNFIPVGELTAKGSGSNRVDYTMTDKNVKNNVLYYRLKLIEQSGDLSYSKVVTLSRNKIVKGFIAPNPIDRGSDAVLTLQSSSDNNTIHISIINISGQPVLTESKILQKGKNEIKISTGELARGIYLVSVTGDGLKETYRLVVH